MFFLLLQSVQKLLVMFASNQDLSRN